MLLGFKRFLAPFVEEGSKTHTIRGFRKYKLNVGETCHCYVDPRQSTMRLLGRFPCDKIEPVRILTLPDCDLHINIAGVDLSPDEVNSFAWRDGFRPPRRTDAHKSMWEFWVKEHSCVVFEGQIIHWNFAQGRS